MAFSMKVAAKPRCSVSRPVRVVARAHRGDNLEFTQAAIVTSVAFAAAAPAAQAADVDSAVDSTIQAVLSIGDFLKGAASTAEGAAKYAGQTYEKVSPQISSAIEKAAPVVKQGVDEVGKVAGPAIKQATPVIQSNAKSLLEQSGVDLNAVSSTTSSAASAASGAFSAASPQINKVITYLTTSPPEDLAKAGLAVVAAYFLLPVFVKSFFGSLRGFAGELSPARVVDLVAQDDSAILIDLRSAKEKGATGVPDVPSSARGRFVELESCEIERRLRGQLRNAEGVECQITALEIQALKRVSKGSKIVLMDKSGNQSKNVAKDLSKLGFRSVYTVAGGFGGWNASKLQIRAPVPGGAPTGLLPNIIGTVSTRAGNGGSRRSVSGSR